MNLLSAVSVVVNVVPMEHETHVQLLIPRQLLLQQVLELQPASYQHLQLIIR